MSQKFERLWVLSCVASLIRRKEMVPSPPEEVDLTENASEINVTSVASQVDITSDSSQRQEVVQVTEVSNPVNRFRRKQRNPLHSKYSKFKNFKLETYMENTSDELSKKFSYKCRCGPGVCSKVTESYGNEEKALNEMRQHIWDEHPHIYSARPLSPAFAQETAKSSDSSEPVKKILSDIETDLKIVGSAESPNGRGYRNQVLGNQLAAATKEIGSSDPELNDSEKFDIIKSGDFEHTYALSPNLAPVRRERKGRIQRQRTSGPRKFDLNAYIKDFEAKEKKWGGVINMPPFPFVYSPHPLEPISMVEFDSKCKRVLIETGTCCSNDCLDTEQSILKKRLKTLSNDPPRPVLECVENKVSSKPNASSEQKQLFMPDDTIENTENITKNAEYKIALRNVKISRQVKSRRTEKRIFQCEVCRKNFTANTTLCNHFVTTHLGIFAYTCPLCEKHFTRGHSLKYHLMIHANKNRFACSVCNHKFRHPTHYKTHLRKHTGEEPFSCELCPERFKTRNSLKRHLKVQHKMLLTTTVTIPIPDDN